MTCLETLSNSIEHWHACELGRLKLMYESGSLFALPAALHHCLKYELQVPRWTAAESVKALCKYMAGTASKKRGSSARPNKRQLRISIDYSRWSAVHEVREARERIKSEIKELRRRPGLKARTMLKQYQGLLPSLGTGDLGAFECASDLVAGTVSQGGAEAVKKSYARVEKAMKDPAKAAQYHLLDSEFARAVGINPGVRVRI